MRTRLVLDFLASFEVVCWVCWASANSPRMFCVRACFPTFGVVAIHFTLRTCIGGHRWCHFYQIHYFLTYKHAHKVSIVVAMGV